MKKILILSTGGTITSSSSNNGLIPSFEKKEFENYIKNFITDIEVEIESIFSIDSSNIQVEQWKLLADKINSCHENYNGIIILHGTDTMAYSASILSFMLQNIKIPIVLTGSQVPITMPLTDAIDNIQVAISMAKSEFGGIYIAFNRKIILGTRGVKVRTLGFDAFESINYPYIGVVDSTGLLINKNALYQNANLEYKFSFNLNPHVFLIKLTPAFDPEIFDMLLNLNYKGIVIEAFGLGGLQFVREDLIEKLENLVKNEIAVVVCSQCLYEKSDLMIYEVGRKSVEAGVIEGLDMTSEAAVTKLIWALGQTKDLGIIKKMFGMNFAGEIFQEF